MLATENNETREEPIYQKEGGIRERTKGKEVWGRGRVGGRNKEGGGLGRNEEMRKMRHGARREVGTRKRRPREEEETRMEEACGRQGKRNGRPTDGEAGGRENPFNYKQFDYIHLLRHRPSSGLNLWHWQVR